MKKSQLLDIKSCCGYKIIIFRNKVARYKVAIWGYGHILNELFEHIKSQFQEIKLQFLERRSQFKDKEKQSYNCKILSARCEIMSQI